MAIYSSGRVQSMAHKAMIRGGEAIAMRRSHEDCIIWRELKKCEIPRGGGSCLPMSRSYEPGELGALLRRRSPVDPTH